MTDRVAELEERVKMKKIHGAGLLPTSTPKQKTWCGRYVCEDQLPILGTNRKLSCKTCLKIHAPRARFWANSIRRAKYAERKGTT
jgi:hypothetical protein